MKSTLLPYNESLMCFVRFCAKNYYPFNPKNKRSYVVDDDYTPAWEVKGGWLMYEYILILITIDTIPDSIG